MTADEYKEFLREKIAKPIACVVAREAARHGRRFHANCRVFCQEEDTYREALGKALKRAETENLLQDYNEGRPPKENMQWYFPFGMHTRLKGFWTEPLPFSPAKWIRHYYGWKSLNTFLDDKVKEPNAKEDRVCRYVVVGLVHDQALEVPMSARLCNITDEDWRNETWEELQLSDRAARQDGAVVTARLTQAFEGVKGDLASKWIAKSGIAAMVCSLIMVLLFELFVYIGPVSYVRNHPHTYGIQAITACLISCLTIGAFMRGSKRLWWWAGACTFLAALLSVL